jgi:hypothetical protein
VAKSTSCVPQEQVDFRLANGMEATAGFNGGDISPFGGMVLLSQVDDSYGFLEGAARCIKDKRNQASVTHEILDLLKQIVLLICAGYSTTLASNYFRKDPMLKLCTGWMPDQDKHAAAQATISRFLNERSKRDLLRLFSYFISFYIRKHDKPPKSIELDFDGAAVEAHGRQQMIAFNAYYEMMMYFPLFVFDQNQWLIAPILRSGNVSDAGITVDVLKVLVKRLRRAWPNVSILLRGDAAFHDPEIMYWCEENGVEYVLGLKGNESLYSKSRGLDDKARTEFKDEHGEQLFAGTGGGKQRNKLIREISAMPKDKRREQYERLDKRQVRKLGEFMYQAGDGIGPNDKRRASQQWKKERRVLQAARVSDRGLKRKYLVTSMAMFTPQELFDIYSVRGKTAELSIRSMKALGAHRLSSTEAIANQLRLLLEGLAHNLFNLVREQLPAVMKQMSALTLIHEFVRIPVQVKVSTRRIWLRWTSSYPWAKPVLAFCKRLT